MLFQTVRMTPCDEESRNKLKQSDQIAALPVRFRASGDIEVLLITSRDTKRWVMPKGWPMKGVKPWKAAEIEALEEAGIRGRISHDRIGTYDYEKRLDDGSTVPCSVALYPIFVEKTLSDWKERDERERRWFSPKAAAKAVDEPGLSTLLQRVSKKPSRLKFTQK